MRLPLTLTQADCLAIADVIRESITSTAVVRAGMKPVHHFKGKSGAAGSIPAAMPALPFRGVGSTMDPAP